MKRISTRITLVLAALALPLAAQAHDYTYLEGGLVSIDQGREDETGLRIGGSVSIAPQFALIGEVADAGDLSLLSAGGLFHTNLQRNLDLVAGLTLEHVDAGRVDDTGFGLRGGLRWLLADTALELNPELRLVEIFDDSSVSARLGALYGLTPKLSLQGAVQGGDDDRFEFGLRYDFGA